MYYGILSAAVVMIGFQFLFNQRFEKNYGNSFRAMLVFTAGTSVSGLLVLLIINKFRLEFTPFSLILSVLYAADLMLFNYFSLKSLGKINLSLYSVFSMLGGMLLPFVAGIAIFNEALTFAKIACIIIICVSLFITVDRSKGLKGIGYYVAVFVLNGMFGIISKVFQSTALPVTSEVGFSILCSAVAAAVSFVLMLFCKKTDEKLTFRSVIDFSGYGVLSRVANWIMLVTLSRLPASVQYPFITGGVMIVSTIICFFTKNKPSKREIISIITSFIGIMLLVLL